MQKLKVHLVHFKHTVLYREKFVDKLIYYLLPSLYKLPIQNLQDMVFYKSLPLCHQDCRCFDPVHFSLIAELELLKSVKLHRQANL